MLIDAHVHITPDGKWFNSTYDASLTTLLAEMDENKVSRTVLLPIKGAIENEFVTTTCLQYPGKFIGAVSVDPALEECVAQLDQYFKGTRKDFSLKLALEGTEFQQQVWRELSNIPYGQTASYLDIARAIGNEQAVRAVGAANGQNPISIIIPCHRVIGSDGKLTGYGGGLWRKEWLLTHERNFSVGRQLTFL